MNKRLSTPIATAGLTLGVFALLAVILLAGIQWLTKDRITENGRDRHLLSLHQIIAPKDYDNDLLSSVIEREVENKHLAHTIKIYTAKQGGAELAKIYGVTSLEGYSGAINLLVGVNLDQSIRGIRVTAHKETPGLGDKIETTKSDWILKFAGKALGNPILKQWKVKKDGGKFDQFTGATITPRAVVNAVRETLKLSATEQ